MLKNLKKIKLTVFFATAFSLSISKSTQCYNPPQRSTVLVLSNMFTLGMGLEALLSEYFESMKTPSEDKTVIRKAVESLLLTILIINTPAMPSKKAYNFIRNVMAGYKAGKAVTKFLKKIPELKEAIFWIVRSVDIHTNFITTTAEASKEPIKLVTPIIFPAILNPETVKAIVPIDFFTRLRLIEPIEKIDTETSYAYAEKLKEFSENFKIPESEAYQIARTSPTKIPHEDTDTYILRTTGTHPFKILDSTIKEFTLSTSKYLTTLESDLTLALQSDLTFFTLGYIIYHITRQIGKRLGKIIAPVETKNLATLSQARVAAFSKIIIRPLIKKPIKKAAENAGKKIISMYAKDGKKTKYYNSGRKLWGKITSKAIRKLKKLWEAYLALASEED